MNCRFWGSVLLPLAAGLDLPYILWKVWHDQEITATDRAYQSGVVGRHLVGDTKHLLLSLRGRPRNWTGAYPGRWTALRNYGAMFFDRNARTLVLTREDPKPFLGRILQDLLG